MFRLTFEVAELEWAFEWVKCRKFHPSLQFVSFCCGTPGKTWQRAAFWSRHYVLAPKHPNQESYLGLKLTGLISILKEKLVISILRYGFFSFTNYPLLLDIRIPCLKGTTLKCSRGSPWTFGWFDSDLQATGIDPGHFFIFLPDWFLNFWQNSGGHGSRQRLVFAFETANEASNPWHNIEIMHQIMHVLCQILGLTRRRIFSCWRSASA